MATMPGKPFHQSQGTPLAAFFNIPNRERVHSYNKYVTPER